MRAAAGGGGHPGRRHRPDPPKRPGPLGYGVLVATALLGALLGAHGFLGRTHALSTGLGAAPPATKRAAERKPPSGDRARPQRPRSEPRARLGPLLSSTPYASVAYELYPSGPSAAARQALAGFEVTTVRRGSSVVVSVDLAGSNQPPQTRLYPADDRVYFVEANLGDDSGNLEYNLGDDGLVVTDPTGHIVE